MALIVQKYGGTSVANPERIKAVADKVAQFHANGDQVVGVVSAMSGETNRLLALAEEVSSQRNERELDVLVSTGEQVSIAILAMAMPSRGVKARSATGTQVRSVTEISSVREHSQ